MPQNALKVTKTRREWLTTRYTPARLRPPSHPFVHTCIRASGASKTPDILLASPIGVFVDNAWRSVCWIDSKALFGDENTHRNDVVEQAQGYVHRYGPGMILYWFGHAPTEMLWEGTLGGKDIVVVSSMPNTRMFPNGRREL